jgi:hypothetical protein
MRINPFYKYLSQEDHIHITVVNHLNHYCQDVPWWHTPNEGRRTPFERYKQSLLGIKSGVPDICILKQKYKVSSVGGHDFEELEYAGLFIEFKIPDTEKVRMTGKNAGKKYIAKSKTSDHQALMIRMLEENGYKVVVCYTADDAINIIDDYLKPIG